MLLILMAAPPHHRQHMYKHRHPGVMIILQYLSSLISLSPLLCPTWPKTRQENVNSYYHRFTHLSLDGSLTLDSTNCEILYIFFNHRSKVQRRTLEIAEKIN